MPVRFPGDEWLKRRNSGTDEFTAAAWAIAHCMVFTPGSLSVIACPAQRQSAEAVRRVRGALVAAGAELKSDNVYGLEL